MYDDSPLAQTPFHTNINGLDQTTLTLSRWEYNAEKEFMEVAIKTKHDGSDAVRPKLSYSAKESGSDVKLPVEVIYQDDSNVVVHIKEVPNKYKVVGLFVKETRDKKMLENEARESFDGIEGSVYQDGEEMKLKLPKPTEKVLVGDYRTVKLNDKLTKKDKKVYQAEIIEGEIEKTNRMIARLEDERIPHQENLKKVYAKEILALEKDMAFQTSEEQDETNALIYVKEGDIKLATEQIEEYEKQVRSLEEKVVKLNERLDNLHGKKKKEVNMKDEKVEEVAPVEGEVEGAVEDKEA